MGPKLSKPRPHNAQRNRQVAVILIFLAAQMIAGRVLADEPPAATKDPHGGGLVPVKPLPSAGEGSGADALPNVREAETRKFGLGDFIGPLSKSETREGTSGETRSVPSGTIFPHPKLTPDKISRLPATTISHLGQKFKMPLLAVTKPLGHNVKATAQKTSRGMLFGYNTQSGGFSGGGFTYDHFGTSKIEAVNLSGRSRLVLGLKGDPSQVKLEIVDHKGKKASVILEGIKRGKEQVWSIPTSAFKGVDLKKVRILYFIIEGNGQSGKLIVNRIPAN